MRITLAHANTNKVGLVIPKAELLRIAEAAKGAEILGQVVYDSEVSSYDPMKTSHIVSNISFNEITNALEADIEILPLPYGEQLELLLEQHQERVSWLPVIAYDDTSKQIFVEGQSNEVTGLTLISVNALITEKV